jgi:putative iron-regulated protein
MATRGKTWLGVGIVALAGGSLAPLPAVAGTPAAPIAGAHAPSVPGSIMLAQAAEAGGEAGGEAGEVPESYVLPGAKPLKVKAKAEIARYATGVYQTYVAAEAGAKSLQAAIAKLLADPTPETLAAARRAWTEARPSYLVTEAYRFYDGPIEDVEGRINAWPVDESFIDYVQGKSDSGIINDPSVPMTIARIDALDQKADESDVTTGWHAIEFLLWGQDLSATGPGDRPVSDYLAGQGNNDRRRAYLQQVTDQLVSDLGELIDEWQPGQKNNYAATFLKLPEREALGRIFNGVAVLAGSELMSERMAVGLDSGDQEDEHSCFSDTTHQDFVYDVKGIADVWFGSYAGAEGPGLDDLVRQVDPALAEKVRFLISDATSKIAILGDPWDRVLAAPADSLARARAEEAVTALGALGDGLKEAGTRLGVLVQIPSG